MKFCPECGNKLDGKTECDMCGYNKSENEKEEMFESKNEELFVKPGFIGIGINPGLSYNKINGIVSLKTLKEKKMDLGELKSICFSSSGGMMGGISYTNIDFNEKVLETYKKEWHHSDEITKRYTIEDKELNKIKSMIEEYNFPAWSEIDVDRTFIAFDAPSRTFALRYTNNNYVFDYNIYMDEEERNVFYNFREYVGSLIKEERLISENVKRHGESNSIFMGMGN